MIAVPGDVVDMKGGIVYINGQPTGEPYAMLYNIGTTRPDNTFPKYKISENDYRILLPFTVPQGKNFMLKDTEKSVTAVPGDVVNIDKGVVYINDRPTYEHHVVLRDNYTMRPNNIFPEVPFTVPEGKYFMLGDNRGNSQDSRFWGFASIDDMRGPVFCRYWPLDRIGIPK